MEHHFDIDIASRFGMLEAVLLNNFWFWITKNKANNNNFHDGFFWTYNSTKALSEMFPYVSARQISNALKKLKDEGVLQTGNYNKVSYDRTSWYSFTPKGECIMQKCKMECEKSSEGAETAIMQKCKMHYAESAEWNMQKCEMDYAKMSNGLCKNVEPIPDNKTDNKTNNKTYKKERKKTEITYDSILNELNDDELKKALYEFIKMRKMIKKPLTNRALELLIQKLYKMSNNTNVMIAILEQSIMNNWQGIFPIKEDKQQTRQTGNPFFDLLREEGKMK